MEDNSLLQDIVFKREVDPCTQICRCCLSTDKQMKNVLDFRNCFEELAGITVSESDGLPQWLCGECCALITKAARIRWKILKAHGLLYEYSARCAPFPIDAQDVELSRYGSPNLSRTPTLILDFTASKMGFSKVVQHEKINEGAFLELDLPAMEEPQEVVKEEGGFSDYEDNITLEEYRSTVNKSPQHDSAEAFDQAEIEEDTVKGSGNKKRKVKKSEKKPRKKKKNGEEDASEETPTKSYIRKTIEIDPAKIRIVTLNPEEQIKQREEESKAGLKFPYQCNLCYKGFNFEAKLQNHMYKHSPARGTYKCKLCTMYLPTMYSYSVHSLIHTRRYECVQCGRRMIDRQSIIDHYRTEHEGLLSVYTCHVCGKVSNNNKTHRGHMRNHHSGERPKCDQCGKTFVNGDSLAQHLQIHEGIKNYECPECNKKFRTRTQLKHHQLKHTDVKDYYCVECDVRFKSQHNLRQHLKKNLKHKDKQSFKYLCTRCPKRFENSAALSAHVAVQHEGVRAHACPQCPAALATRSSLAKHVRAVHKGARAPPRHVCDTCGKAFRGKSVLTNHVRTHTGEKPYECWECGRKFTQRTAMRTHVKLVHLKIRRTAKIKPEMAVEEPKMESIFKEEAPLAYEGWNKNQLQPCDIYFTVATALAP